MSPRRNRFRPFLLVSLGILIVAEIVVLSPSPLNETQSKSVAVDAETFIQNTEQSHEITLAPGIPQNRIPDYGVDQFRYVSVQNGEKQWRIEAEKGFLYNPERLTHSRGVTAYLYDSGDGEKVTLVTGREAKYFLNQRDLEVYGDVKTVFPDGFEVNSQYMHYQPNNRHIEIPTHYAVQGVSHEASGQDFTFTSMGLDYVMGESQITLPEAARVILHRNPPQATEHPGVPDVTTIESDRCLIFRDLKIAKFTMKPSRPLSTRFVHITQPTLFARSRKAELHYGDFSQVLQYLIAFDDVLIKEIEIKKPCPKNLKNPQAKKTKELLRYATGGQANFDTQEDIITLTKFPQAYQEQDTVTGDTIIMHRDTDLIEIEHSNAFSQGPE